MTQLEYAQTLGLTLGGRMFSQRIGWTTDKEKATKMREVGASVVFLKGSRRYSDPVDGWEITVQDGAECL